MIKLTRFTGEEFFINPETIKSIEPGEPGGDTVVILTTGERILVQEKGEEIQERFLQYKKHVHGTSSLGVEPVITNQ